MAGNLWMFSDQLDDEDFLFARHDFITIKMACEYYGLGEKPCLRMMREAGAVYKIGSKMVRINRIIFEQYLRDTRRKDNDEDE